MCVCVCVILLKPSHCAASLAAGVVRHKRFYGAAAPFPCGKALNRLTCFVYDLPSDDIWAFSLCLTLRPVLVCHANCVCVCVRARACASSCSVSVHVCGCGCACVPTPPHMHHVNVRLFLFSM